MANILFKELGFPVLLINPAMVTIRGEQVPDVNMAALQRAVFAQLITKPARLTGAEVRFIRKYRRLRQADLARVLNNANHSVVSHWESREDEPSGMAYNSEVVLRLWMAAEAGWGSRLADLLAGELKNLALTASEPLAVCMAEAA